MKKPILILLISILLIGGLIGCSTYNELIDKEPEPQIIKEECKPIIKEKILYKDRNITMKEPCNTTNITCPEYNYTGSTSRELELIRRLKFLENQQDKYFNDSECNWELNRTEDELEDCREELCDEWNSSWC